MLRFQQHLIRGLDPARQNLLGARPRRIGRRGAEVLCDPVRGTQPRFEDNGRVLKTPAAEGEPCLKNLGVFALDIPKIRKTGTFRDLLQYFVKLARHGGPGARVEHLHEYFGCRRVGAVALRQLLKQPSRKLGGRRPKFHKRLRRLRKLGHLAGEVRHQRRHGLRRRLGHGVRERAQRGLLSRKQRLPANGPKIRQRLAVCEHVHAQNSTTCRTAVPSCRRSNPSLIWSSLSRPLISLSTGNRPR